MIPLFRSSLTHLDSFQIPGLDRLSLDSGCIKLISIAARGIQELVKVSVVLDPMDLS
jgi:hypothetical protein